MSGTHVKYNAIPKDDKDTIRIRKNSNYAWVLIYRIQVLLHRNQSAWKGYMSDNWFTSLQ